MKSMEPITTGKSYFSNPSTMTINDKQAVQKILNIIGEINE